ncbi:MAG: outer membrane beta-barrel protein [bacterium]|nr:outer membrane beta-barrel protein [bacterium]
MMIFRVVLVLLLALAYPAANASAEHRLGGGVNYWVMLDDLDDDFDDKGLSYLVSYQYWAGLIGVELDVELLPDRLDETAIAPQAYLLIGKGIYAGAGIGIINSDGDFADKPFFALKAGVNLELLPSTYVDISANYRFSDKEDLDDKNKNIDTDTVFLGAAFRFAL